MMADKFRQNIIANYFGNSCTLVASLVCIPFYIRMMGPEAYGLVGIFISLRALFAVFDLGLSSTLCRELARLSTDPGKAQDARDTARTLQCVCVGAGLLVGVVVVGLAPAIAYHWVHPQGLSPATVARALRLIGIVIAIQWPIALCEGGLIGLQKQVRMNVVRCTIVLLQHGGALLILALSSRSVTTFFQWHVVTGLLQTGLLMVLLQVSLPHTAQKAAFRYALLGKHWRFSAGMTAISLTVVLLTQLDKVVLAKLQPLAVVGYYSVCQSVAGILVQMVTPIHTGVFPRLSQLSAGDAPKALRVTYHSACQYAAVVVLPAAAALVAFPRELLWLWTQDWQIAEASAPILRYLAAGSALNALMMLPYALQVSHGWTRLSLGKNVIAVFVLVPLMVWLVRRNGAGGAALTWLLLNAAYVLLEIPLMHRRLLPQEMTRWYVQDVLAPLAVVSLVMATARLCIRSGPISLAVGTAILAAGAASFVGAALAMPSVGAGLKKSGPSR